MKVMRYFVAILLLLTGVLHILPIFMTPWETTEMHMIAFGIIYFVLGLLLMLKRDFSPAWGIIFPMIGLVAGFFVIGFQHWTTMLCILFAIDAVVVICCMILFFNKRGKI
jgi:uncharacterized membrane protein HdeD (DUF308 family)